MSDLSGNWVGELGGTNNGVLPAVAVPATDAIGFTIAVALGLYQVTKRPSNGLSL